MASNVAAFTRRLELHASELTGDAFREMHAKVARRELARVQADQKARRQVAAPFERYVDGRQGAPEDSVKFGGVIEYEFSLGADVAAAVYEELLRISPVGPAEGGHYRDDHWIFVNGVRVADLRSATAADEIIITNTRPYARKIEGGAKERFARRLTNRRPGLSVQAPNGVYEVTAHAMRRRFGNVARIEFTYRGVISGSVYQPTGARAPARGTGGRFVPSGGAASNKSDVRFPAIIITPL